MRISVAKKVKNRSVAKMPIRMVFHTKSKVKVLGLNSLSGFLMNKTESKFSPRLRAKAYF